MFYGKSYIAALRSTVFSASNAYTPINRTPVIQYYVQRSTPFKRAVDTVCASFDTALAAIPTVATIAADDADDSDEAGDA